MVVSLTAEQIKALNICDNFTQSVDALFAEMGVITMTVQNLLDSKLPITKFDRIWVISEGQFLSSDQINEVKEAVYQLVDNNQDCRNAFADRNLYSYSPISRYLSEHSNMASKDIIALIETTIINKIDELVE